MQVKITAKLNSLRMSPQKVRLVTGLVRKMGVEEALAQLSFLQKDAALPVKKLLESGIANAKHNYNIEKDKLKIENITVDEGKILYRWMPRAMGRATPLRKRSSHITLILIGEKEEETVKKDVVDTNKKIVKKEKIKKVLKTKNNLKTKSNK